MPRRDKLLDRLRRGLDGLHRPAPVPESARHVTESTAAVSWCPAREVTTGDGNCRHVDCGACPHLAETTADDLDHLEWLCSDCARQGRSLGYWKDGNCDACGDYSIVLDLVNIFPGDEE